MIAMMCKQMDECSKCSLYAWKRKALSNIWYIFLITWPFFEIEMIVSIHKNEKKLKYVTCNYHE